MSETREQHVTPDTCATCGGPSGDRVRTNGKVWWHEHCAAPVTPEPPPLELCFECGQPAKLHDQGGCAALPASEARPTTESVAASATYAFGCQPERPEVAQAKERVLELLSSPYLTSTDEEAVDALILAVQSSAEGERDSYKAAWEQQVSLGRDVMIKGLEHKARAEAAEGEIANLRATIARVVPYGDEQFARAEAAESALAAQAQEIDRLKAEWEKASDKYHAEADSQIEWQARAEAAELALRALQDAQATEQGQP